MIGRELEERLGQVRPQALLAAMVSLVLLTLLAGHLYVLKPSLARLRSLETGGSDADLASAEARVAEAGLAITTTELALTSLRDELYGGPSDLPPEKTESYIIDRLDRISQRHAVELISVSPGDASPLLMFEEVLYEVEVQGRFFELVAWLLDLEQELRPLVVNEFRMTPEPKGERVGVKLRLASYRPSGEVS